MASEAIDIEWQGTLRYGDGLALQESAVADRIAASVPFCSSTSLSSLATCATQLTFVWDVDPAIGLSLHVCDAAGREPELSESLASAGAAA